MEFTNKTYLAKLNESKIRWHLVNAKDRVLGEVAVEISKRLMGKMYPDFTPQISAWDKVVVINSSKIRVSNDKLESKTYFWHTGFPGGIKQISLGNLLAKKPTEPLRKAVKRMLPQNRLLKKRMANLYIYPNEDHDQKSQFSRVDKKGENNA